MSKQKTIFMQLSKNVIGTDMSIKECIKEGYTMMDTEGHEKLNPDYSYADDMPEMMKSKSPSFHDLLRACDTIQSYCGLD